MGRFWGISHATYRRTMSCFSFFPFLYASSSLYIEKKNVENSHLISLSFHFSAKDEKILTYIPRNISTHTALSLSYMYPIHYMEINIENISLSTTQQWLYSLFHYVPRSQYKEKTRKKIPFYCLAMSCLYFLSSSLNIENVENKPRSNFSAKSLFNFVSSSLYTEKNVEKMFCPTVFHFQADLKHFQAFYTRCINTNTVFTIIKLTI